MYETAPLPSIADGAAQVQHNVNDGLAGVAEQLRALRIRMRASELSPTSLEAAAAAHRTLSRLGDLEHECARMRAELEAIEWRVAL